MEIGLVEAPANGWKVFGAQSAGCNPIAVALHAGTDVITPVKPTGIAKSLNIGDPAAGLYALEAVRRTGGWMDYADDDEIRDGIRLLARTHRHLRRDGRRGDRGGAAQAGRVGPARPDAETVVFNTGEGLKTLDAVAELVGPDVPGQAVATVGARGRSPRLRYVAGGMSPGTAGVTQADQVDGLDRAQ